MVQPESASPFDVFGVSAIEVVEEIQTVLTLELMENVTVGDDEFEDTFGFIEGTSDFHLFHLTFYWDSFPVWTMFMILYLWI